MRVIAIILLVIASLGLLRAQDTTRISLLFAGDVMGHDSQIASAYDPATRQYQIQWYNTQLNDIVPQVRVRSPAFVPQVQK